MVAFVLCITGEENAFYSSAQNISLQTPRRGEPPPLPTSKSSLNRREQLFLDMSLELQNFLEDRATFSSKVLKSSPAPSHPPARNTIAVSSSFRIDSGRTACDVPGLSVLSGGRRCRGRSLLVGLIWSRDVTDG